MGEQQLSIVRRGNHFIYLDGAGWVLIDGPWFDRLEKSRVEFHLISVLAFEPISFTATGSPETGPPPPNEWERTAWHPGGMSLHPDLGCLAWRWNQVLAERRKAGYRIWPDGKLPCYFNRLEFVDDPWWHDQLVELGY